jgi:cellulose biosynthesis protein BcsQ
MLTATLWGFLEPVLDAIDWNKLAVPAGGFIIFSVAYYVSSKLAQRSVTMRMSELESDLRTEKSAHIAAKTTIESLKIQQAAHASTMQAQLNAIQQTESQLRSSQSDYSRVHQAGQKLYRELLGLRQMKEAHEQLQLDHAEAQAKIRVLEDSVIGQDEKLRALRDDLTSRETEMGLAEKRMRRARKLSGYIIKAKALLARPKFKPLLERKRPIISVAALKGGVGKTTITSHLAGALARKGYRVLLIDLDLQGSLTGLMLDPGTILNRVAAKQLMQDFFIKAAEHPGTKLTDYIAPVPQPDGVRGTISIVPTSDRLAYAELNLTLGWLLKQGERDVRFLLRRALHLSGANANYDIVLLDCPPVLNISCANALAASDYLLIPTLLSAKSVERVPNLVKATQEEHFVKHLNSQLRIMGVIANRSRFAELKAQEAINWQVNLPKMLQSVQNKHTKLFDTIIAQDVDISSKEEQYVHPKPGSRAYEMFAQLLSELEQELPDVCRIA